MAVVRSSPKFFKNLRFRSTSSPLISGSSASPLNLFNKLEEPTAKSSNRTAAQILSLEDGERLFSSIPTPQLLKSIFNLRLISMDSAVDAGAWVMRSALMENRLFKWAILKGIKRTVYGHFCAGENVEEASRTLQRLWDIGLKGMLDYGLEDSHDNEGCDRNFEEFLNTIKTASLLPASSVTFISLKITAIFPISLLEHISDLLRWKHMNPSFNLPWELGSLPVLCNSSPLYLTSSEPPPLSDLEEEELQLALQRLMKLCEKSQETNVPLLVDAEYTAVQPAIDYFTYAAAIRFNKDDNPIIFGTFQAYLRDAKERLILATESAERRGMPMGLKLVRGAYITRETAMASSMGFPSPIHPSIKATHECYNECTAFLLKKIARGHASVVLATHNLESGKLAASMAEELGIRKGDQKLQFSQLMGMADGLSLGLKNAGFIVSKYLPFGPLENIIPYLLRRAEENRGLLSASALDRQLMRGELKRRLKLTIM